MPTHYLIRATSVATALTLSMVISSVVTLFWVAPSWAARTVQGELILDNVLPAREPLATALQRYRGGSEARLLDWTSDGTLLVATRRAGRDQLLRLGAPEAPLALDTALAADVSIAPAATVESLIAQPYRNEFVAYLADESGGGNALFIAPSTGGGNPTGGGNARLLVHAAAHPSPPAWSHEGRQLAFSAALRDARHVDLYVADTVNQAGPRLVAAGGIGSWQVLAWTDTDHALLVRHVVATQGDELLLVDVATGALRRVDTLGERTPGMSSIGEAQLAPDGRGVYFISQRNSELARLRRVDLKAEHGADVELKYAQAIEHFDLGATGRTIAYSWSENGYSRVALLDQSLGTVQVIARLPPGHIDALKFDRNGTRLAIELAGSASPRDVYVYHLSTRSAERWTHSDLGEFNLAQWVAPQAAHFQTWDRLNGRARALLVHSYHPRLAGPRPALVLIGDTGGSAGVRFDPLVQTCVNELGLAVIVPELRSGEAGALDLGAVLAWIGTQTNLRRDRIALLGYGSGGTLALTSLGLYGDRLRAAVSIDGPASSTQLAPIRQPALLVRGLVRGLASPTLDAGTAEQMLWRLRTAGADVGLIAPREAHGVLSGEPEQILAQQAIAQFLWRTLADENP